MQNISKQKHHRPLKSKSKWKTCLYHLKMHNTCILAQPWFPTSHIIQSSKVYRGRPLALLYFNPTKNHATGFTDRSATTHDHGTVDLLEAADADGEVPDARRVVPNVVESC